MTQPEQPGTWSAPSWPAQQPPGSQDRTNPMAAQPVVTQPVTAQPVPGQPFSGQPLAQPAGQPGFGQPLPAEGYAPPAPGYPPYGYPVVAAPPNNGLSIAALVVSIVGIVGLCGYGIGGYLGIVGAILGHVSRRQIRAREQLGQPEGGDGMALAGIIMGWIATVVAVLATAAIAIFFVWAVNHQPSRY